MDGYSNITNLCGIQEKINNEILQIAKEIAEMPKIPHDIDEWASSISDIKSKNFSLSNFKRMFQINKKYDLLEEEQKITSGKIKIIIIDSLLEKIKKTLGH